MSNRDCGRIGRRARELGCVLALAAAAQAGCRADGRGRGEDGGGIGDPNDLAMPSGDGGGGSTCAEVDRRCPRDFALTTSADIPVSGDEQSVEVRGSFRADGWMVGEKMTWDAPGKRYRATVSMPWATRVLYKFRVVDKNGGEKWYADPNNPMKESDGFGGFNSVVAGVTCERYTCPPPPPPPPDGGAPSDGGVIPGGEAFDWRDAVLYFVFVDRFFNGNPGNDKPVGQGVRPMAQWQGGDWAGVTMKVNEGWFDALGVNALWITVPMDNTDATGIGDDGQTYTAYHGYWPRDLSKPEARFGTMGDLKALVDAAHKRNIKIVIDYAMNHVHRDSPVYQQHQNDGWFYSLDLNGARCVCGEGACSWDGPNAKRCWFRDYLPDFNFENPAARKFSVDNALWWIDQTGIDGFRLDAVKHLELQWLVDLRGRLGAEVEPKTKQHVYLVGETYTGDQGLIKSFIDPQRLLDGQFDFPLRSKILRTMFLRNEGMGALKGFMDANDGFYGAGALMSTFIGNHDVPRTIHFAQDVPAWGNEWDGGKDRNWNNTPGTVGEQSAYERMAAAMAVLMTNKGVPLIYYGDEIGLPGAGDPDNRRFMQWQGYSGGQLLLFDRMKKMGAFRAAHPATRRGTRQTISVDDDAWLYSLDYTDPKTQAKDRVWVAVNRAGFAKNMAGLPNMTLKDAMTGDVVMGPNVQIPPRSARLLAP